MAIKFEHNPSTISNLTGNSQQINNGSPYDGLHGAYHLAKHPELYEIQRKNNFELYISFTNADSVNGQIDKVLRYGKDANSTHRESDYITDVQQKLRLSVSDTFVPSYSQDVIKIRRGNNEMKFAGVPTYGNGTINFNDYIGAEVYDILAAWQAMSYNPKTEKVGLVEDYKKNATLIEYSPDYQPIRYYKISGLWISSLSKGGFDYENGGKQQISCTFEYDSFQLVDTSLQFA